MKDEMKFIFGQVHADEGLKDRTRAFLAQKTREERQGHRIGSGRRLAWRACCLADTGCSWCRR